MRAIFATAMVIFSKKPFQKIVGDNYVKALRSWLMRHIDNSILKDTLQLKILGTWINARANYFIKALVKIMKRKWRRCLENYHSHKNAIPLFKEYCTEIDDISLVFICFFFSQTNLVFRSNPVCEFSS